MDTLKLPQRDVKKPSLLEVVNELLRTNGPRRRAILAQQMTAVLGVNVSESHLSEVLGGDKHIPETWLKFWSVNYDPEGRVAECVAGWKGLRVRPARTVSDAAFRRAAESVLAQHNGMGAALRSEIEARALEEPETDETQQ